VFGVVGALALSAWGRTLTWTSFTDSLMGAVRLSCMINLILAGARLPDQGDGLFRHPGGDGDLGRLAGVQPVTIIVVLTLIYLVLGCFIDGISMIVLTASVVLPIIAATGFDLIWFGIFIVLVSSSRRSRRRSGSTCSSCRG
jgi:TRAP-type C4-dicarboxylate transport system permease large subunit